MIRFFLVPALVIINCSLFAQQKDAHEILNETKSRYTKIRDFTAQAEIIVDVNLIKIPDKYATVYYKYPDKYRFKSKGFIMVPRKGLNFSIADIMNQPATLVYAGEDTVGNINCDEIKILPEDSQSEIVLATVYIDPVLYFVRKMEAITRKSGSYTVYLFYDQKQYPLPDEIKISFDVGKLQFPLKFMGDVQVNDRQDRKPEDANVIIKYTDYIVNEGVSDAIFMKDSTKEN